jgi:DNA polymerase-3 subunit alpha
MDRIETHAHSMYSNLRLIDSINRPRDMLLRCAELGLRGCALTDHETLSGHVSWITESEKLKKEGKLPKDFKAILGNEIYLVDKREPKIRYYHYILLAKNDKGVEALSKLSSTAWYNMYSDRGMERVPTTKDELSAIVKEYPDSLIATTACVGGELANLVFKWNDLEKEGNEDDIYYAKKDIVDFINWNKSLFGEDFYIEVAPSKLDDQLIFNEKIKPVARATNTKMIFATDAHYLKKEDRFVHKSFLNSKEDGEREVDAFYAYSHFQSNKEAFENLQPFYDKEDFAQMCANSMGIYDKIEEYHLFREPIIPEVKVPELHWNKPIPQVYATLNRIKNGGAQERFWLVTCLNKMEELSLMNDQYLERLNTEAEVISFIGDKIGDCLYKYFNTFHHYINLFWDCGSIVGPGRGSACGFLSNYLLDITQLDPVKWKLNWWRFLNKERVELPDIDIDLAPSKRPLILKKIREERGELNVIQVATFGTEGTRNLIKTACRGYRSEEYPKGISVDVANYLSSLIPEERGFLWDLKTVVHGDESKGRKPVKAFIEEVSKYDGLLDIMTSIEGLVSSRGTHASGVILYNDSPFKTNSIMRSGDGTLTTQLDLHQSEARGDVKFDFLVTKITDKLTKAIELLKGDGYFPECNTLKEIYFKHFHPDSLKDAIESDVIWDSLENNTTLDVFQFNSQVGSQVAKNIKPHSVMEMTMANALMRLQGEKGQERPEDRFIRMKDISQWYKELEQYGITEKETKVLEPYYLPMRATPVTQETLMEVCMDKNIAHFTLGEANNARKIVGKKKIELVPQLREKFISACPSERLGKYVWKTTMQPQMSYAFSINHALPYSFIGIQTLVMSNFYPSEYWQTACLIVNSGGDEAFGEEEEMKNKSADYGRIAKAIGEITNRGVSVSPPSVNKADFTFRPDVSTHSIAYGLKGVSGISSDCASMLLKNRPYNSLEDVLEKCKLKKPQVVSLIKSGALDEFGDRQELMKRYIDSISDKKKTLNLRNVQMLIRMELLPKEKFDFNIKVFGFNKDLKKINKTNKNRAKNLVFDKIRYDFYEQHFDMDLLFFEGGEWFIDTKQWDKVYKAQMEPIKQFIAKNKKVLLEKVNHNLFQEMWNKYAKGSISKWEMQSMFYYFHPHELVNVEGERYHIKDFKNLPQQPVVDRTINIKGKEIPLFKIERIMGTVIDKNKNKRLITLLTPSGVVNVKLYGEAYAKYDRRISERGEDGKNHVVEESWFSRGTLLIITGIRRGADTFVAKKYARTPYHLVEKITEVHSDGTISKTSERAGGE